jgi:hypothetical protein
MSTNPFSCLFKPKNEIEKEIEATKHELSIENDKKKLSIILERIFLFTLDNG